MAWFIPLLLCLSACASITPVEFKGPNGNPAFSMRCSGMGRTLEDCYQKAGELCPNGYTVVDRASSVIGVPVRGGMLMAPQHSLAVECSTGSPSGGATRSETKRANLEVSVMPVVMPPAITAPVRRLAVISLSRETNARVLSSLDLTLNFLRIRHTQMILVEREQLSPMLDEIMRQYGGTVSDESMVRLGRQSGADTLLTYAIEPLADSTIVSIAVNGGVLAGAAEFRLLDVETGAVLFRQGVTGTVTLSSPGSDRAYPPDSLRHLHRVVTSSAAAYALAAMAAAFGDNPLGLVPNLGAAGGGVVVMDVLHGGPAHGAGLKRHDRLLTVNGESLNSWMMPVALPANLTIEREGNSQDVTIRSTSGARQ